MRSPKRFPIVALVLVMILSIGACKSSGPKVQAPPPEQASSAEVVEPDTDVTEEVVSEPVTETIVSEEVTEELPEDLAELNARGYLGDVFFDTDLHGPLRAFAGHPLE